MRDTFVRTLVELAKEDKNIELVTGDLGFGVLKPFWEQCPDQFTNAGIAEQNMMGIAAGLAKAGLIPFVSTMAIFATMRAGEQVRTDIAYQNLPVKIIATHAGISFGHDLSRQANTL
jgi:transketolase